MSERDGEAAGDLMPEECFDRFLGHDWMPVAVELRAEGAVTTSVCTRCGTPGVLPSASTDRRRAPLPEVRLTLPEARAAGLLDD